ncbi:MAG TPA: nicotinamide riboside transporter PnuC [Acidobacteriota bacterium]|nr:nicotinamide riboside transporter PnuC [Acidobacteriota bacterium]
MRTQTQTGIQRARDLWGLCKSIAEYFKDWNTFERAWIASFFVINLYLFFAWHDTILGLVTSLTGMLCVVLVAKGKISNYYFGLVNILGYSYISYTNKLYGEVMLNMLYFLPTQFIGLYLWYKHADKKKKDSVQITRLSMSELLIWTLVSAVGTYVYALFLGGIGGRLPIVDSFTTVLSIVAQILMLKRVVEQWLLWILIDVASVVMWFITFSHSGNDVTIIVMWAAFLVNAIYGYLNWRKMYHDNKIKNGIDTRKIRAVA